MKGGLFRTETQEVEVWVKVEHSFVILSPKKLRNEEASWSGAMEVGKQGGDFRESKASRADHSFFG